MKLTFLKTLATVLAAVFLLGLSSCGEAVDTTDPQDTIPIITRPPETTSAPETEGVPKHAHIWSELPVYTAYSRPDRENDSIGYTAYPCTVEGCEEIRDDLIRPVLIALDFEGETTLYEYLEEADRVSPFFKKETSFSEGTVTGGTCNVEGGKNEQVFIVSDLPLHELEVFTVSFDAYFGISSLPDKDTFFGFGKSAEELASVYYFQLRERGGKLYYLKNFTEDEQQSNALLSYTFEREKWYHFDVEIDMVKDQVSLRVGEWDETRTSLISTSNLGTCEQMHAVRPELDIVVFRISASNGLASMDNFFITLPEE